MLRACLACVLLGAGVAHADESRVETWWAGPMLAPNGYNVPPGEPSSSGVGIGDLTLQAGYGVLQYRDGHYAPAVSLVVQETLPTGRYDRLERASDGLGTGAYSTTLAVSYRADQNARHRTEQGVLSPRLGAPGRRLHGERAIDR